MILKLKGKPPLDIPGVTEVNFNFPKNILTLISGGKTYEAEADEVEFPSLTLEETSFEKVFAAVAPELVSVPEPIPVLVPAEPIPSKDLPFQREESQREEFLERDFPHRTEESKDRRDRMGEKREETLEEKFARLNKNQ